MSADEKPQMGAFVLKASQLREIVGLLSGLVEETKWVFDAEGLKIKHTDTSHIAQVVIAVPKKAFSVYLVNEDFEIGVDLNKMKDVLKLVPEESRKQTDIEILMGVKEGTKILVRIGRLKRWMQPVDLSGMYETRVPVLALPAKVPLRVSELIVAIRAAEAITDHVAFNARKAEPHSLLVEAEGDTERIEMPVESVDRRFLCVEEQRSVFPLDYVSTILKSIQAEVVEVSLGNEYPAIFEFKLAEGPGEGKFLLAPRIEN